MTILIKTRIERSLDLVTLKRPVIKAATEVPMRIINKRVKSSGLSPGMNPLNPVGIWAKVKITINISANTTDHLPGNVLGKMLIFITRCYVKALLKSMKGCFSGTC
jgi:hypothetical protein